MKLVITFLSLISLVSFNACQSPTNKTISFYHWKSKARSFENINNVLVQSNANKIFMHYFDVEAYNGEVKPVYVLSQVDDAYKNYEIVPVVFITNNALNNSSSIYLSKKISSLIHEISSHHFNKNLNTIQLDCDWTQSTKTKYFELINKLQQSFTVSVTIRLHQIKFREKTGIPPVAKGTLMLYNVGDLKNEKQNSILQTDIVEDYINESSSYPIELDVALPLFSQTVIKNNTNHVRIINGTDKKAIEAATNYFSLINTNLYLVKKDTLFKGFYLSKGYKLKLEYSEDEKIIASYNLIKQSKLNTSGIIFYHLDEQIMNNINIKSMIEQL